MDLLSNLGLGFATAASPENLLFCFVGTLLGTRLAIRFLVQKGYGQLIRDDGPTSHHVKRGTPTMGGLVIIAAVLVAYFGSHLLTWTGPSASALLILFLFTGLGAVGFLDDWLKIRNQRSLGLRSKAKIAGQSLVAIVFALLSLQFPDERGITPASQYISFLRDIDFLGPMPVILVVLWVILLIAAASNGPKAEPALPPTWNVDCARP